MIKRWLIVGVMVVLGGCSAALEGAGLSGPDLVAEVTVVDQQGVGVKCAWSYKRHEVSCPGLLRVDKASVTGDGAVSNPPARAGGD